MTIGKVMHEISILSQQKEDQLMTARYAPEEVVVTVTYYVIYYYDFILKEAHAASPVGIYHFWGC